METYVSPLTSRYASPQMSLIFSPKFKYMTWRRLWVALANAERELGVEITPEQIREMEANVDTIDFANVKTYEREFKHEVMAHIHAYGDQCPLAKGIIHLGATSSFVMDNTDLIQMKEGLILIREKLSIFLSQLNHIALNYADTSCLAYTHLQIAQPTTVGKRFSLYLQDFLADFKELLHLLDDFPFLGVKGATGTQAAFLTLFDQDHEKVRRLDTLVTEKMGFDRSFKVASQTYPRKMDMRILSTLSGLAVSAHKFATDLRLLANFGEVTEAFDENQIGSSAMPHKQNPIRSERICSLARYLISLWENTAYTASTQWLERTLDDSANRRLTLPGAFLTADSLLNLLLNITPKLKIHKNIIEKNLKEKLPFLALENLLISAAKDGGDRQEVHEKLRQSAKSATSGEELIQLLEKDIPKADIEKFLSKENFSGRSKEQVIEFLKLEVEPILQKHLLPGYSIPIIEI